KGLRRVRARRGEDAVVTRERCAHANHMEEPGAERSQRPGLKIKMNESLRPFRVVSPEKSCQVIAAKVMDNSRGNIDLPGESARKGGAVKKGARQRPGGSEPIRFVHKGGVKVHPRQLDFFGR